MRTLYRNGVVVTMDREIGTADAVLVDGDRFEAVGAEALDRAGTAEVVDLGGATVVPGLIDAHAHLETDAVSNARWVDVRDVEPSELLERLRRHAAGVPAGTWIVGQASFSQDRALPDRHQLDSVAPDHPVLVRASMHALAANTLALRQAGLMTSIYAPTGTVVERDSAGTPTGHLLEAFHLFPVDDLGIAETADLLEHSIHDRFNRYGVTTVYEVPMSRQGMRGFQVLDQEDRLNARIALFPAIRPGLQPLIDDIEHLASTGIASGFGNDRLWLGGAKFFMDSIHDEAFWAARDVDHPSRWGAVTHLYSDVVRALSIGYRAGLQLWFHAIGVGAQQVVIDAALEAQRVVGGDGGTRTRIEHIFNERSGTPEMYADLARAGIIPVPNAVFIHIYGGGVGAFPYRTLIEEGFMPPGNSDNSGTQPFANNPWFGIQKLTTRLTRNGEEILPDERIGVFDGLRTYTEFGAFAGHREGRLGVIRPGAFADFAVLDADPFTIAHEELGTIQSALTVMGGRTVWQA
ncbi:amidohydrolase family protein [Cnuibacter physcomitrellae]|uniref:amidohydrolase n=1 Tax=Cnuibacter physcomitrellae TaxID=1619308 RepID=UPI002175D19F|nr:amidohydrolase family protein [Cnuibacter physcomitrellae]MCS5498284.1 amidohydrolase family protein [Cnuibacter physcomitrellae]